MGKNQHVLPHPNGWQVKGEDNKRATVVTTTQAEAIKIGKVVAMNNSSELLIHGKMEQFGKKTHMVMILILQRDKIYFLRAMLYNIARIFIILFTSILSV